jgi:Tol biopolymer transport system component
MQKLIVFALFAAAIAALVASPAVAKRPGSNGKLVVNAFNRATKQDQVYTVNPDGTDPRPVASDAEAGQWSPDGTRIPLISDAGEQIVNVDTGSSVDLRLDAQYPGMFLGCGVWSPDGARLACEALSDMDPSRNGIYTVRSSDGSGLQRITSNTDDDCASDYSPDGNRLVFTRASFAEGTATLFVLKLDATDRDERGLGGRGGSLTQLTPPGMEVDFCTGSWSPQGNDIVFSAHVPASDRSTIWVVHSNGSGLRQLPVPGCGGPRFDSPTSIGCSAPVWSPDGTKIVLSRFTAATGQRDLYTVSADGSGLTQVTNTPGIDEETADWGTHPLTP